MNKIFDNKIKTTMANIKIHFIEEINLASLIDVILEEFGEVTIGKVEDSIFNIYFLYGQNVIECIFDLSYSHYTKNGDLKIITQLFSYGTNENKEKAFRKIARHFNCELYPNDCNEDNIIKFNV